MELTFAYIFWSWATNRTNILSLLKWSIMLTSLFLLLMIDFVKVKFSLTIWISILRFQYSIIYKLNDRASVSFWKSECWLWLKSITSTMHIQTFLGSIMYPNLIAFFLNWLTRPYVYFRFYLSSSVPSLSLIKSL